MIMLVISRKKGESAIIGITPGVEIKIVVVEIERGKIRLGFEMPRSFPLLRQELYLKSNGFTDADYADAEREGQKFE